MASLCGGSRQRSTPRLVVKGGVSSESLRMGAWGGVDYIEPARTGGGENPPDKMISSQSRTRRGVARCACGVPLEHLFFTYHKLIRHKRIFNARGGWAARVGPGRSFLRALPALRANPSASEAAREPSSDALKCVPPHRENFCSFATPASRSRFRSQGRCRTRSEERPHWRQVRTSAVIRRGPHSQAYTPSGACLSRAVIAGFSPLTSPERRHPDRTHSHAHLTSQQRQCSDGTE